jgi:uncharacterized protein (DUF486 family)
MLNKQQVAYIEVELVLAPLAVECLQSIALANFHMKSPLYRHLLSRFKDCKISILDQILTLVFFVMFSLATRLQDSGYNMPYTASCTPLVLLLVQKFVWH